MCFLFNLYFIWEKRHFQNQKCHFLEIAILKALSWIICVSFWKEKNQLVLFKNIFIESKFDNTIIHTPVSIELHSGKKVLQLKLLWKRLSYAGVAFLVRVSLKLKSCFRSQNIVCIHKQGRQLCGCIILFKIFLHFETSRQGIHSICENLRPKNYGCTH